MLALTVGFAFGLYAIGQAPAPGQITPGAVIAGVFQLIFGQITLAAFSVYPPMSSSRRGAKTPHHRIDADSCAGFPHVPLIRSQNDREWRTKARKLLGFSLTAAKPGASLAVSRRDCMTGKEITAEIERIRGLTIKPLRALYRKTFGKDPPDAFSKDLIARAITYRIQEKLFGGLDQATKKRLDNLAGGRKSKHPVRHLASGTVLLREYQGERHTVTIADGHFIYCETKFPSLTKIARKITGTAWNGPRFFGLRVSRIKEPDAASAPDIGGALR